MDLFLRVAAQAGRMYRSPIALICILTAFVARNASAAPLSLEQALTAVDETSLNVLLSREALAQAIATANQSRAALLPNVTLDATQRRSRTASVGGALVRSGINNRYDENLNGRLDLLSPQRIAAYSAARATVDVAKLDLAATRETILATVSQAYLQHQRNVRRIDLLDSNVRRARALLDLARRQTEAGITTQIDVTRAEAQLAAAEQARLQQDTVVQTSEFALKRLLALDLSEPLQLAGFSARRVAADSFAIGLEQTGFEKRADYLRAMKQLEENKLEVRAAKFNRLPSLSLIGSYGYATENAFDGQESNVWSGSVAFSMPIFDGLRTRALTNLALSRLRAQELRVRDVKLQIGSELRLATQDARSRFEQVSVAERSLKLAEDELRLAQIRFEQGAADNREVIDAQNQLALAGDNLNEAVYQYNLSRVELARAKGDVRSILAEKQP
jgi:outer membrane protein